MTSVDAPSCTRGNSAVWTEAQSAAEATEMDAIELPEANLAEAIDEAERRDIDPDDARAPRKRRAVTHDDSDNSSLTSDTAKPRKKASRASRASTTEAVKTVAGSSRSTAKPRPTTKTQPPPRSPAASRQPDADGSVAPPRRHTALQQTQPLPTANAFAGASVDAPEDGDVPLAPPRRLSGCSAFKRGRNQQRGVAAPRKVHPSTSIAAATEGGPSASSTQRTERAAGERQQPTAPSTASPGRVATAAPTYDARDAAPRRRRRRPAGPPCRWVTDCRRPSAAAAAGKSCCAASATSCRCSTERSQRAAPVAEASPAAPAAPWAPDAAELRSLLRSLSQQEDGPSVNASSAAEPVKPDAAVLSAVLSATLQSHERDACRTLAPQAALNLNTEILNHDITNPLNNFAHIFNMHGPGHGHTPYPPAACTLPAEDNTPRSLVPVALAVTHQW
ncbi:serine/arginine repetitive matrix protein 1-like [Schistocerca serialis cubense]|uniref:serine/arginine repetitive matrix protein 1-like n=1 Tax=Schistocerca serialis cubense TaxID=2023355 RepID=UPI00214F5255|nr:serine/arginine repetitive matrix protein 1-like [Schistocerca serialis cubense]